MEETPTSGTNILRCRYYENRFPEHEDVVVVNVRSIAEMGAYVHLLEYNGIEGMILLSELSRRRIRSINKLLRVGRNEVVVVIRVDKDKGYIDLSKRRVSNDDVSKCEEKFSRAKAVNQIMMRVAGVLGYEQDEQLEELYNKTAWHFDRKAGRPAAAFDAFKATVTNPDILDECQLDEHTREVLLNNIRQRLLPQTVKIRADLEVSCFKYEGINAIRVALAKGLTYTSVELPLKINLIAPPLFVMTVQTLKRQDGLDKLTEALEAIKESIIEQGGQFELVKPPRVVSDVDDAELKRQMAEAEEANREVSGDSDSESSESGSDEDEEEEEGDGDKPTGDKPTDEKPTDEKPNGN